jgi:general secretion pathway protein G
MILRSDSRSRLHARAAFTLLEVLIVVAIIVVLAGGATLTFLKFQEGAYEDTAYTRIKNIEKAALAIQIRSGALPGSIAEMVQPSADGGRPAIDDPEAIKDPWGREFQYDAAGSRNGGSRPDIWTVAPNGKTIGNWPGGR